LVRFTTRILQFAEQGEKTGWTYVEIPAAIAERLKPGIRKSFRVKGFLDKFRIAGIALIPMGGGNFIMPLNAAMRKNIHKGKGAMLNLELEADDRPLKISPELLECLEDEPKALAFFNKLPKSHQLYFSKWIESAKTEPTRAKRIAQAVTALARGHHYGQMLRSLSQDRNGG
jgi:hypothetical protein